MQLETLAQIDPPVPFAVHDAVRSDVCGGSAIDGLDCAPRDRQLDWSFESTVLIRSAKEFYKLYHYFCFLFCFHVTLRIHYVFYGITILSCTHASSYVA
jgi:hypothetical protein